MYLFSHFIEFIPFYIRDKYYLCYYLNLFLHFIHAFFVSAFKPKNFCLLFDVIMCHVWYFHEICTLSYLMIEYDIQMYVWYLLVRFHFLSNLMRNFNYLYFKLCLIKNSIKIWYYESIWLNDSNNISHDYIFSNTLVAIYKINLKDK